MAMWLKVPDEATTSYVLDSISSATADGYGLTSFASPNDIRYWSGAVDTWARPATYLSDDVWTHVIIRASGASVLGYINGGYEGVVASAEPNLYSGTRYIGSVNGTGSYFDGAIDDFAIWDGALNTYQMEYLYEVGVEAFEASGQAPEPASMVMLGIAAAGIGWKKRRKR